MFHHGTQCTDRHEMKSGFISCLYQPIPLLRLSPPFPFVHVQITVSSGGMLVQKLRTGNLQSERGRYDGTMVYAQHKVRTERENLLMPVLTHSKGRD